MSDEKQDRSFQLLVLQGMWVLALMAMKIRPHVQLANWRGAVLRFCDEHGNQSVDAPQHRRCVTYWMPETW